MKDKVPVALFTALLVIALLLLSNCSGKYAKISYPPTIRIPGADTLHGTVIIDNYRWLENYNDSTTQKWLMAQDKAARAFIDKLPQRKRLIKRFNELWRYDDEKAPENVLVGDRVFFWATKKDWERYAYYTKENEKAEKELLFDPNTWGLKTLDYVQPSRDGKYVAYGVAEAGNEEPVIKIFDMATKKTLPDSCKGWRQGGVSWLPDNAGFYYSANPLKGDVPEGEESYWDAVYFHRLGTSTVEDKKVFYHDQVKEFWHGAGISEDGKYILFYRGMFNKTEIYYRKLDGDTSLIPIVTGMDARYSADIVEDKLIIWTDLNTPKGMVYITDVDKPGKKYWREFIPESEDNLSSIMAIAGHLYAVYLHNAHDIIKIFDLNGKYLRDLALPTIGSVSVRGYWSKPDIWVNFSSYTYPNSTFKYDFDRNELALYYRPPIAIDVSNYVVEQVWYKSKDGTEVSMFLIHRKNLKKDGRNAVYLTGYGGFDIPEQPYFSSRKVVWLEAGGMVAAPNLRGGGEYGKSWHEAGMLDKKQNVFDDFIAAAEWLIENKYTNPQRLAIGGGSNGGLLTGAVTVQRPDLFKVIQCEVPLLDMLRYHKFSYANIWAEEYGNADDPEQFKYLLKYSPYHNVVDGAKYPAVLFIASDNDARCHPLHAMKMAARMQAANAGNEPIFLLMQKKSGHVGGTTMSEDIEQASDIWSFLMDKVGLMPPKE